MKGLYLLLCALSFLCFLVLPVVCAFIAPLTSMEVVAHYIVACVMFALVGMCFIGGALVVGEK